MNHNHRGETGRLLDFYWIYWITGSLDSPAATPRRDLTARFLGYGLSTVLYLPTYLSLCYLWVIYCTKVISSIYIYSR
jgi:hypothetical protein